MSLFIICDFDLRLPNLFLFFNTCEKFSTLFFFRELQSCMYAHISVWYEYSMMSIYMCKYVLKYVCL